MAWRKIADSKDIIVFENQLTKYKLKIEARKNSKGWEIFKTKIDGDSADVISEHFIENKKQALSLIKKLKKERTLYRKRKGILLKRLYKEEFIEKWAFSVDGEKVMNFLYVKFDTEIKVDIIMYEKYMPQEKKIINQIEERLGLKEIGESFEYSMYYFRSSNKVKRENPAPVNYLDIEFDFSEDYY